MTAQDRLSIEFLRECFEYRDGVLYWRERPAHHFKRPADHLTFIKRSAGKRAGRVDPRGYVHVKMRIDGHPICPSVHRIIWAMHYGQWPKFTIDHIDRNPANNRIENMRDIPMDENLRNRGNPNATGLLGAYKSGKRFTSSIKVGPQDVYLGTFDTPEAANQAYMRAMQVGAVAIRQEKAQ